MSLICQCCLILIQSLAFADAPVDYRTQVRSVLQERCFACHGALKQEGSLRLDTTAAAIIGGDSGPSITTGDATGSELFRRVSTSDASIRMPPEGEPLKPAEIDAIRRWIDAGAQAPADEAPESDPRDHWAFRAPVRPPVPKVNDIVWSHNPVDAFVAASREHRELIPQTTADRRVWLRRVYFDLIGLPPTLEEQNAFLNDSSPHACDKAVAMLLDSPLYGERWGRHWMDIWRYSDWWGLGAEVRNSQKHIWHWRDWIIESLNSDKAYDQMLREMLAADELYPNDPDRLRATGFLARQYFKFNRTSWLDETIQHTSKAMLGLTFNCAKCHDHKYDPISQLDYYQMRAFFEPYQIRTDMAGSEVDFEKDGIPRTFDCNPDAATYVHIRGDDRNPDTKQLIRPGVPAFLNFTELTIAPVILPLEAWNPGLRQDVVQAWLQTAERRIAENQKQLENAQQKLEESELAAASNSASSPYPDQALQTANGSGNVLSIEQASLQLKMAQAALRKSKAELESITARSVADRAAVETPSSPQTSDLIAAAAKSERVVAAHAAEENMFTQELNLLQSTPEKRAAAEKELAEAKQTLQNVQTAIDLPSNSYSPLTGSLKTLENNLETEESRRKPFPRTSTGRRSALAHWIAHPENPLTARVAVNHIWARHFGAPLVPTVFDLGRKGIPPTHPELLDWLAVEFIEHGWSMKHIHQLIVTSQTWRMTSTSANASAANLKRDSENRYYWRANPMRMEAQLVRDSMLHLAGDLDLTIGGPSIPVTDDSSRRRSLYYVHSHNEHQKFLSMFDDASVLECYRRADSIVPQQALALENSELASRLALRIAARISDNSALRSDEDFVRAAFQTVLSADATEQEVAASVKAMQDFRQLTAESAGTSSRARTMLIHALINHNDFVTIR